MAIYGYIPHLVRLKKIKGFFKIDLTDIPVELKREAANHLRDEVLKGINPQPVNPVIYFLELFAIVVSDSNVLLEKFLDYYSRLALKNKRALGELKKYLDCTETVPIEEYLVRTSKFPVNPLKIYWLKMSKGVVQLEKYSCIISLIEDIVNYARELKQKLNEPAIREELLEIIRMSQPRRKGTPRFYRNLLEATGIEDGKRRIIMYWLAPYLVTIHGMTKEEAINTILEWLTRQDGKRVPAYWVRAEVESVARKGLKPWKREKVFRIDPQLKEILEKHGII